MAILDFSVSGWHGFGSVTQVCFGISVSNFMCMSFVAVGRSLTIVSYVAFKMAALWFWTMFNCNPPIAHCHPLLWGGGILVDHWSAISSLSLSHDDVIKWKHFPRYWPFVRGIHRSPVNSPHKGQWRGALMFSLICARINGLVNNREAGDLRRHRPHYDVIVMLMTKMYLNVHSMYRIKFLTCDHTKLFLNE